MDFPSQSNHPIFLAVSALIAFLMTLICVKFLRSPAEKLGLVDYPGGRKKHPNPVLTIGGVCMFIGFCFGALTLQTTLMPYRSLFAGGGLLVFIGLIDDMQDLSPYTRLLVQLFAACLMAFWGGVMLRNFGNFFTLGNLHLGNFGIVLTVLAVMGMINAVNMLDGVDGLAGSLSFIELLFLCFLAIHAGRFGDLQIITVIICVLLAFLVFNFPKDKQGAKIFMGDAGSMWLGFVLTWFCISLSQEPNLAANPVTFLWIMSVPLFDMMSVVLRRIKNKRSPFKADRQHLHHIFHEKGLNAFQITFIMSVFAFVMGSVGLVLNHDAVHGYISIIGWFVIFGIYHFFIMSTGRNERFFTDQ